MAKPTPELITALRETADRLAQGVDYQWTHQGACNCGHLVQTVTKLDRATIHALALEREGEWADKALSYCATSRFPIDHILGQLFDLGMYQEDVVALERLADPDVLARMPQEFRPAEKNNRTHVVAYLRAWAELLEDQWLDRQGRISLPAWEATIATF